jgi:hypothetical protein
MRAVFLGALHVACHPEQVISGAGQHVLGPPQADSVRARGESAPASGRACDGARDGDVGCSCDWDCDCSPFPRDARDCAWACTSAAGSASSTQVSFVPPALAAVHHERASFSATRVSPPGTICTVFPERTNGRRSMWRGAMPASTKVGHVESASVGCAM